MKFFGYLIVSLGLIISACQSTPKTEAESLDTPASASVWPQCLELLHRLTTGNANIIQWSHPSLDLKYRQLLVVEKQNSDSNPALVILDEWGRSFDLSAKQSLACPDQGGQYCFWYIPEVDGDPRIELRLRHSGESISLQELRLIQAPNTSRFPRAWLSPRFSETDPAAKDFQQRLDQLQLSSNRRALLAYQRCLQQAQP